MNLNQLMIYFYQNEVNYRKRCMYQNSLVVKKNTIQHVARQYITVLNTMCMPINSVCPTIRAVLKDIPVDFLPDPSTVSYFIYELGIMSDLQVDEDMYCNENITLSWDATSIDGCHIN